MDVQKEQLYDDEIDLFDLVKKLWRWKKMIVGVTLTCTILMFGIYSFFPKIYRVNAIIEPGTKLFYKQNGQMAFEEKPIESPVSIRETILGGVFDKEIADKLALNISDIPKIKVKIPKDTNLLIFSLESHDTQKGIGILNELISKVSGNIQTKIDLEKQQIESMIKTATEQVLQTRKKIERLEASRKEAIGNQPTNAMSVLLYFNEIKEHQIYLNELEDKVMNYRHRNADIRAIRIHLNPTVEENPVGPKKFLATAGAFIFSLFASIVLALILEKVRSK
ncbi:MAG: hypothetical protein KKD92_16065 [Proteobacteria bacterium]|nr:hypothetical protein [Pseudomonadota bacterium]